MTTIWTLLEWFFYGLVRYIVFWIPLLTPPAVDRATPWQWWLYYTFFDWIHKDDNNGGPDEHWLQCWFGMLFNELLRLGVAEAEPYVDRAQTFLEGLIGSVRSGFASLSDWSYWLELLYGLPLPWWSATVKEGLYWLRWKLPSSIQEGWQTWQQIWDGIVQTAKDWAKARYDAFMSFAFEAYAWIVDKGALLRAWQARIAGWIDWFIADPYGAVTGWLGNTWDWLAWFRSDALALVHSWLGPHWPNLLTFGRDCVTFYYNLWSIGWQELGEFCSNPLQYLYDKAEQILIERW